MTGQSLIGVFGSEKDGRKQGNHRMADKLNLRADMEELDKLGETIENALTEQYGDGAEGVTGRSSVNDADTCTIILPQEVHERILRLSQERAVSIDQLITRALDMLHP